jgi:protein TonB
MFYKQSTRFARIKAFVVLPLAVCIVMIYAISCKQVNDPVAPPPPPPPPPPPIETTVSGDEVFTVVENMPQFPGGEQARIKYMTENIKYPESAKKEGLQGTVYISFVVQKDGQIADAKVVRGIGKACDEEALRVVNAMPKWKPGEQGGKTVRVQFNMPIKFTLGDK